MAINEKNDLDNIQLELQNNQNKVNDKNLEPMKLGNGTEVINGKDKEDTECGIGKCRPDSMQCCAGILSFSFVFGFGTLIQQALQTYLTSQITTLEKQYNISSFISGLIVSSNDVGFALTTIIFSHFCKRYHIPKTLALCMFIYAVAGIATVVPHFITATDMLDYSATNLLSNPFSLCIAQQNSTIQLPETCNEATPKSGNLTWVVVVIGLCLLIQGTGASTRTPLGTVYVDNNVDKKKTGFYLGITQTIGLLGPFIALILGGAVLTIPVDLKETALNPINPRWIGAWWIGYFVFGAASLICALMYVLFPKKIKRNETDEKGSKITYVVDEDNIDEKEKFKEMGKSVASVLCNPVNMLNIVGAVTALLSVAVLASFGPKYMEEQYNISTAQANIILGVENLVTASLGTFLGGYLVMRLKLTRNGCLKMVIITHVVWCIFKGLQYVFGCENPTIHNEELRSSMPCQCDDVQFLSVCGRDGRTYYSPCKAGCINVTQDFLYGGCSMINGTGEANPGICNTGCTGLVPFIAISVIHTLVGTLAIMPVYIAILRSCKEKDRSVTMGILSFALSVFVYIPGPILIGLLIDSSCMIWRKTACGARGACSLYDIVDLRIKLISTDFGLCVLTTIVNVLALIAAVYQTRHEKEKQSTKIQEKDQMNNEHKKGREEYVNSTFL